MNKKLVLCISAMTAYRDIARGKLFGIPNTAIILIILGDYGD